MTDFQAIQQKYYEFRETANNHFGGQVDDIENYVNALEGRELKMLNIFKEIITIYDCKYLLQPIIEEMTGQTIEEVLKK